MPPRISFLAAASLALCLQACVTGKPPATAAPASYFWLPVLGVSEAGNARARNAIDAVLRENGYVRGDALALSLATDAVPRSDGTLGLGVYAGGYAYYAPAPAPAGAIVVEAFDTRTLYPVWRATLPSAALADAAELRRALTAALSRFPPTGAAGHGLRVEPDALGDAHGASIAPGRHAIPPIGASPFAADGKSTPTIRSLVGVGGAERARRI